MPYDASKVEIIFSLAGSVIIMLALSGFVVYFIFSSQRKRLRQLREQELLKEAYEKEVLTTQIESRDQTLRDISQEIHGYPEGIMINGFFPVVVFKEKRNINRTCRISSTLLIMIIKVFSCRSGG